MSCLVGVALYKKTNPPIVISMPKRSLMLSIEGWETLGWCICLEGGVVFWVIFLAFLFFILVWGCWSWWLVFCGEDGGLGVICGMYHAGNRRRRKVGSVDGFGWCGGCDSIGREWKGLDWKVGMV